MARDLMMRLWRVVSGTNARQRRREEEQRRAEEHERWIEHERMLNRIRAENRREMIRAVSDPSIVPFVRARLMETLLDER